MEGVQSSDYLVWKRAHCTSGCWCTGKCDKETGWLGDKAGYENANTFAPKDYIIVDTKGSPKSYGHVRAENKSMGPFIPNWFYY